MSDRAGPVILQVAHFREDSSCSLDVECGRTLWQDISAGAAPSACADAVPE